MEKEIVEILEIRNTLLKSQFCKRCVARIFGETCNYKIRFRKQEEDYVVAAKKRRFGKTDELACRACCGILQDQFLEVNVLRNLKLKEASKYDSQEFRIYVNIPIAILFRQHAVGFELQEKFPEYFTDERIAQIMPINKAFSLAVRVALTEVVEKNFNNNADFSIEFHIEYMTNTIEMQELHVLRLNLKAKSRRICGLSKCNVDEFIKEVTPELFRQNFKYPAPARPMGTAYVKAITCRHEPIFIAGRYCKYSRNMGQTPWVLDDVKVVEESVQDFVFKVIEKIFKADKLIFSASGREDFDVRALGRGRPFYVRIVNPRRTNISFEQFRQIERDIKKCGFVAVRDLQRISRNSLNIFKEGEELKKKTYKAVCVMYDPEGLQSCIDKINNIADAGPLTIEQTTPIRVSHRRTADVRKRTIYEMRASHIEGAADMFELYLVTQAGTYVKEFVHGDFGRTDVCLAQMIDQRLDIVVLDVLDIDLDFPPTIPESLDESFEIKSPESSTPSEIAEAAALDEVLEFWSGVDGGEQVQNEIAEWVPHYPDTIPMDSTDIPLDLSSVPHEEVREDIETVDLTSEASMDMDEDAPNSPW